MPLNLSKMGTYGEGDAGQLLTLLSSLWDDSLDPGLSDLFKHLGTEKDTAEQEATKRQAELGGAINAPRPETNASADLVARGQSRAAAGLLRSEEPRQQTEKMIKDKQDFLLEQREENLKRLGESYKRAADRAERLGDLEKEIKFKESFDKITSERKEISDSLRLIYQQQHQDWRAQLRSILDKARLDGNLTDEQITAMMTMAEHGQLSQLAGAPTKAKGPLAEKIVGQGKILLDPKVRRVMADTAPAKFVINQMEQLMADLPGGHGLSRFKEQAKLEYRAFMQEEGDESPKLFKDMREGFRGHISRLADAQVGVLTDRDVKYAMKNLPSFDQSPEVRRAKIKLLRDFLNQKVNDWYLAHTGSAADLFGEITAGDHMNAPSDSPANDILKVLEAKHGKR